MLSPAVTAVLMPESVSREVPGTNRFVAGERDIPTADATDHADDRYSSGGIARTGRGWRALANFEARTNSTNIG